MEKIKRRYLQSKYLRLMGLIIPATGRSYKDSLAQMPAREALTTKNGGNAFKNFTIGAGIGALAGAGFYAATNIDWNAVGHAIEEGANKVVNSIGSFDLEGAMDVVKWHLEFKGTVVKRYNWYAAEEVDAVGKNGKKYKKLQPKLDRDGNKTLLGETQLIEGTLGIIDDKGTIIFSTTAISGPEGNGAAPDGDYIAGKPSVLSKPVYTATGDNLDFRMDFTNNTMIRTGMQIHAEEDGTTVFSNGKIIHNERTSWGCVSITGGKAAVRKYVDYMKTYFKVNKGITSIKFKISTNNPNAYSTDHFHIGGGANGGVMRIKQQIL